MSVDDFITLCKNKIKLYLDDDNVDIFTLWKDYWTIGATQDSSKVLDVQRGIFGVTILQATTYFDMTYVESEEKLYMSVYTVTDTEEYSVVPNKR